MSIYIYDITFLVLFTLFVIIFLYKRRKNLKREGPMYLYRTQVGVKFINYVGTKYKKTLKVLSYFVVVSGYLLMIAMMYLLWQLIYIYLLRPDIVQQVKIPPLMPLIPYLPEAFNISFLPPFYFTYWIIAIAVIAIFHEFAHGIFAKRFGVKIKTTGFGFLGPFLAAFVEPDEKQMESKSKFQQITILSAGTFVNLILGILFFLLLSVFFIFAYQPAGAMFNMYTPGIVNINSITAIGGISIASLSSTELSNLIQVNNITDALILGTNGDTLKLTKITANGQSYYITIDSLNSQLDQEETQVALFYDLPAINAGLRGAIIQINNENIGDRDDLVRVMQNYDVGDKITITTKDIKGDGEILEYEIELAEDSSGSGRGVIGIGFSDSKSAKLIGMISEFFSFFKKSGTNYEPKFNADLIMFIYNLIWWLALINISVALINMWPVAIFDGGRMFMLTVWAITRSERVGKIAFKIMTYLILGSLLLLMLGWASAIF